ncbi:UbiA prenyltransferase family-domain-containing protein [Irpex rosettiformis]|uniref:UbiA prenyltransferase family-domain-containing protein n=1 Tax=Irpex rosettiformis TaxID=378272 RepID=A0ACB8U8Y1_9APHY|nr:UbiA prenyltransferase family-domain-containing protein [Irpex rosettiformis]
MTSSSTTMKTPLLDSANRSGNQHTTPASSGSISAQESPSKVTTLRQRVKCYFDLTRLNKFPLGNILIIWPCLWGLTMASFDTRLPRAEFATQALVFTLGSTLLHSTACVINDICDVDLDQQVERTKNRPLASGVLPLSGAWTLWGVMTACCFGFLAFANSPARYMGTICMFPLHVLYPLMKRWTYWPQAWLGLAMNWGFLVAWLNVKPTISATDYYIMATMLLGMDCWTIVYDTEYACQDREDDAKVGVGSTALLFGGHVRLILGGFAIVFVSSLIVVGILNGQTTVYYVVSCGGAAVHLTWQLLTWEVDNVNDCGDKFRSNGDMGYLIWAGILLDYVLQR